MAKGWRYQLSNWFTPASDYDALGISFGAGGLHLALFQQHQGQLQWAKQHHLGPDNWQSALLDWVAEHKIAKTPTVICLQLDQYQLLQVDKPAVPVAEIAQALRWSVTELVSIPGEIVVDYFERPVQGAGVAKLNAVAVARETLESLVQVCTEAKLDLKQIIIEELAICDLLGNSEQPLLTVTQEPGQEVCINIVKQGQLYFSRRLRGYEQLSSLALEQLDYGLVDNLAVEIQRSMDYFESQLRQASLQHIRVHLDSPFQAQIIDKLSSQNPATIEALELDLNADGLSTERSGLAAVAAGLNIGGQAPKLAEQAA